MRSSTTRVRNLKTLLQEHILKPDTGGSFDMLMRNDTSPTTIRQAWDHAYSLNVTSTQVFTHICM